MANAFSYPRYPQTPGPDPRRVGQALMMQRAGSQPFAAPGMSANGQPFAAPGMSANRADLGVPRETSEVGDPREHMLRQRGAAMMTGPGQAGWGSGYTTRGGDLDEDPMQEAGQDENPSALMAAIGEALTRSGNGRGPDVGPRDRSRRRDDLIRLGASEFEADLLLRTMGGT